jgi:beta-glucanase (GH16 family)
MTLQFIKIFCLCLFVLPLLTGTNPITLQIETTIGNEAPQIPPTRNGMNLVWNDEFNENGKPDPLNWSFEYGFVRNQELQWYQAQNAVCKNGVLLIEARREKTANPNYNALSTDWRTNREYAQYTSSCLHTKGLQEFNGEGYFEFRARIDTAMGSWPAIWLLGTEGKWPFCGEIDVMEFYRIGNTPTILANVAWGSDKVYNGSWDTEKIPLKKLMNLHPDWAEQFHVWTMEWDNKEIRLGLDGSIVNTIELEKTLNPDGKNPFAGNKKFYILLNLAIGSNGGDPSESKFPIRYEVDYVRVYQKNQQPKKNNK